MLTLYTSFIFVLYMLKSTCCERRIVNGTVSVGKPRYLAYFVRSAQSGQESVGWACGGSIVHPQFILTSAACLKDVGLVYAITGYYKYVRSKDIDKDDCTHRIKKRVIGRAYQKDVGSKGYNALNWTSRDISLAKLESPINFRDFTYSKYCSYGPAIIPVNFNKNFEAPGTQAVTFGWGHKKYYREVNDTHDYNEQQARYASTVVIDKETCKNQLAGHSDIKNNVNLYLICTSGPGFLDENGIINDDSTTFNMSLCNNASNTNSHRHFRKNSENGTLDFYTTNNLYNELSKQVHFRRNGPCQNDHGGPLITWIGGHEYVTGVACGFQVNQQMECVGPYLYTSTFSNGEFLYCMLRFSRRSRFCNIPPEERGFEIVEENIKWDTINNLETGSLNEKNEVVNSYGGVLDVVLVQENRNINNAQVVETEGIVPPDAYHPALDIATEIGTPRRLPALEPTNINPDLDWNFPQSFGIFHRLFEFSYEEDDDGDEYFMP